MFPHVPKLSNRYFRKVIGKIVRIIRGRLTHIIVLRSNIRIRPVTAFGNSIIDNNAHIPKINKFSLKYEIAIYTSRNKLIKKDA